MVKNIILSALFIIAGATSSLNAQTGKQISTEPFKKEFKFLDNITVDAKVDEATLAKPVSVPAVKKDLIAAARLSDGSVETAETLQFKYSLLLDVEVEVVKSVALFRTIDEWYGVKYLFGGSTKKGIDCSALMQVLFTSFYGITLPRTAKMQYDFSRKISRTELKEGDLLFFNTRGGVSHVGMYLANNKFIHASVKGVTISDMFDSYYASRLIGTGRVLANSQPVLASTSPNP